jgi:Alpha-L-arabinofuranosidase
MLIRRTGLTILAILFILANVSLAFTWQGNLRQAHAASLSDTPATVNVNAAANLGTVSPVALGVNTATWESFDAADSNLLKGINTEMLRFPGGSTADNFNWQTNKTMSGGWAGNTTFDQFMGEINLVGAQPMITVNGGTGTAALAASWVQYANVTQNYGVKYWEIGNELFGTWESGNFAGNPTGYADKASQYITAMKAADPSIQIGVDFAPDNDLWNTTVLSELNKDGTLPDFVIMHWYAQNPGTETDAGLLSSTDHISTMMSILNQEIQPYGSIPVFVTETNSVSYNPGKQTTGLVNALFLANNMADWLQSGAPNVDWWDLYNGEFTGSQGANVSPSLYGTTQFGDYGLLSLGKTKNGISEPPLDTPFPSYYGYQMLAPLEAPGSTMVGAGSSTDQIAVHATQSPNGDLVVMLVNKDPSTTYDVNLNLEDFIPLGSATELFYGETSSSVTTTSIDQFNPNITVSPYSITTLTIPAATVPQSSVQVSATTTLSAATIAPSQTETLTTVFTDTQGAFTNGNLDVEIYNAAEHMVAQNQVSGTSLSQGESQTVPLTWTTPNTADTYTVKVFAFDGNGGVSLAEQDAGNFMALTSLKPTFSTSTTVSSTTVSAGQQVTFTTTFTDTSNVASLYPGDLLQSLDTPSGQSVASHATANVNFSPGQSNTVTWTWTVPSTLAPGTYNLITGVFGYNWKGTYYWNSKAATITVA